MTMREDLMSIIGSEYVIDDDEALRAYSRDHSFTKPCMPSYVVKPKGTEEIQEIVKLSNKYGIPLTPSVPVSTLTELLFLFKVESYWT